MNPRLVSSKKWTPFPAEYAEQIRQVVANAYPEETANGTLWVEGRIYPEELLVRIGFLEKGRLRQANFESSVEYRMDQDNAMKMVELCVDALGAMMEAYFEAQASGEEVEFPLTWKPFEFLKQTIYLQFSTINTTLEAEADRLLGLDAEALVQGEDDDEFTPLAPELH